MSGRLPATVRGTSGPSRSEFPVARFDGGATREHYRLTAKMRLVLVEGFARTSIATASVALQGEAGAAAWTGAGGWGAWGRALRGART